MKYLVSMIHGGAGNSSSSAKPHCRLDIPSLCSISVTSYRNRPEGKNILSQIIKEMNNQWETDYARVPTLLISGLNLY